MPVDQLSLNSSANPRHLLASAYLRRRTGLKIIPSQDGGLWLVNVLRPLAKSETPGYYRGGKGDC